MQTKLRQLVISALRRNDHTTHLPISLQMSQYQVIVQGEVPTPQDAQEVIQTIKSVSTLLEVQDYLRIQSSGLHKVDRLNKQRETSFIR
jgi:osmotically-inducible protein OsmY